jgi:hypothetical protein
MHEDFQLHIGAELADFRHLIDRQLARQDDAREPQRLPELDRRIVDGIGLHAQVDGHVRPSLAHQHDQAGVSHDQRVGAHGNHRRHIGQIGLHLGVMRQQIGGHEELLAARMRFFDAEAQVLQLEVVIARAQRIARLTGIHGIRTEIESGTHAVQIARR